MKTTPFILIALFLSGCAGHVSKPGATQEQVNADTLACNYEMHKSTGSASNSDPIGAGMMQAQIFNECLAMKGYK